MRSIMLSGFAAALLLGACGNPAPAENKIDTAATAVAEETATEPTVDNAALLASILAAQPEDTQARYTYRNPAETLAFFQVEPGMTVAEALPGGGWYSKILVDYLGAEGQLIGIDYDVAMWPLFGGFATEEFIENRKSWPETWPEGAEEWRSEGSAPVSAATFATVTDEMAGTADRVLFVRALHNMSRFEADGGYLTQGIAAAHKILKPGGMVGVVQHRSPEDNPDDWANGSNGYLKQGAVVSVFEAAGFELVASSEINANPKDQPVEGDVVWRLPPNLEQVYSTCLEKILEGEPLAKVLTLYLHFLEQNTPGFRFAVLQHIKHSATLNLLTAPSLPEAFLKTIRRVKVGEQQTACGQAASAAAPCFIDSLAAHPHWQDFSDEIAGAGVTSYWSFPLHGEDNDCIGTLAITGSVKQIPDDHTVSHYQAVAANIVRVFGYCEQQQGRTSINWTLQKQVSQAEQELESLQHEYNKLLLRHRHAETQLVHQPLPKSFHSMAHGLIGEINALLGVVHTTLTFQNVLTEQNRHNVGLKQLSRAGLNQFYNSMTRSGSSGLDMLGQAQGRIKELSDYIELMTVNPVQSFPISASVGAIAGVIADAVPHFTIIPCLNIDADFSFSLPTGCFTQVLSELLLNVCQHAYPNENCGRLWISARSDDVNGERIMQLTIEDAGRGIPRSVMQGLSGATITGRNADTEPGGLDRCQRQVKSGLNGTMHVQHRRGGGSRIVLVLPFQQAD